MDRSNPDHPDLNKLEKQEQSNQNGTIEHNLNPVIQEVIIIEDKPQTIALTTHWSSSKESHAEVGSNDFHDRFRWWPPFLRWKNGHSASRYRKIIIHIFLVILVLGWWVSGIVLEKTRNKWIITTFWTWLILITSKPRLIHKIFIFILIVLSFRNLNSRQLTRSLSFSVFFQWVPTKYVAGPIGKFYMDCIGTPTLKLTSRSVRFAFGWLVLVAVCLVSAFGFRLNEGDSYANRIRSFFGLIVFQFGFWAFSKDKSLIRWRTVIVGLILQQLCAIFVLKTKAGYDFFNWIAKAATDILDQGTKAAGFFFTAQVLENHWFFVNTLSAIVFFIALVQMLYFLGVMQVVMVKFAWVFQTLMGVTGVEAVVAAASPFVGQGESVILVQPFAAHMTTAEIHQVMTSGFSTIAGSVLTAYVAMGVPAVYLVSASIMSIPASLAISKLRLPEDSKPLTAGEVVIPEDIEDRGKSNILMKFSDGAWLGLKVAGMILANVLTILALLYTINGLLTWIGQFWGMDPSGPTPLTLELILQYLFYPVAWLMGTPNQDVLKVSRLLALKMISNEFVAYQELSKIKTNMTEKGVIIAIYSLCGFANLGSLGLQIGVLNSLIPAKRDKISRVAISALICGFFSTIQTAAICGMMY